MSFTEFISWQRNGMSQETIEVLDEAAHVKECFSDMASKVQLRMFGTAPKRLKA